MRTSIRGAVPIVVGIAGHRDLNAGDTDELSRHFRDLLQQTQERCPHSSLLVLTSLAEGADRVAARVALELGVPVRAVLPAAAATFERDFEHETSRCEFRELLAACSGSEVVTTPPRPFAAATSESPYAWASLAIVQHCHFLVAFWDGEASDASAGTAWTVERMRRTPASAPALEPTWREDPGPVFVIETRRRSTDPPPRATEPARPIWPPIWEDGGSPEATFATLLARLDAFNDEAERTAASFERAARVPGETVELPSFGESTRGRALSRCYALADAMSTRAQRAHHGSLVALLGLLLLGFLTFQVYLEFATRPRTLVAYGVLLALAAACYAFAIRRRFQRRHMDHRALAESVRVQFFWDIAGVPDPVSSHTPRLHLSELGWIPLALRGLEAWASGVAAHATPLAERLRHVQRTWVATQAAYFGRALDREHGRLHGLERARNGLFLLGLLLTATLVIGHEPLHEHDDLHSALVVVIALCLASTAALGTYLEQMLVEDHARRYEQMRTVFRSGAARLEAALADGRLADAQSVVRELGLAAVEENSSWLLLHRSRPLPAPRG